MSSKEEPTRVIRGVVQQGGRAGKAGVCAVVGGGDAVVGVEQLLRIRGVDERGRHAPVGEGGGDALQARGEDEGGAAQRSALTQRRGRLARHHGLQGGAVRQRQPLVVVQTSCTNNSLDQLYRIIL